MVVRNIMKVNYPFPNNKQERKQTLKTYGMLFESVLNETNEYYRNKDIAYIYKKPTPIQVVKVDYPDRTKAKITEAYYRTPSTTDYNGIYKGKYIDYEAKETIETSFSFTHIFPHQIDHLLNVKRHGAISFVIIYFKKFDDVIMIDIDDFYKLYDAGVNRDARKSITYATSKEIGYSVPKGFTPLLDYLKVIDEHFIK